MNIYNIGIAGLKKSSLDDADGFEERERILRQFESFDLLEDESEDFEQDELLPYKELLKSFE